MMVVASSYCCSAVESPFASPRTISGWVEALRFFGFGIGVMNSARRRYSLVWFVG